MWDVFSLLRQNQWEEPRFEYSWNKSLALHSMISLDFVNTITLLSLHVPAGIISRHQLFYWLLFGIILNQAIRTCLAPHSLKKPKINVVIYEGQVLEFQIESVYPYKYLPRSIWPIRWKMLKLTEFLQPITHEGMLWLTAPLYACTSHSPVKQASTLTTGLERGDYQCKAQICLCLWIHIGNWDILLPSPHSTVTLNC